MRKTNRIKAFIVELWQEECLDRDRTTSVESAFQDLPPASTYVMHNQEPSASGRGPRAVSDTYTTLPARAVRHGDARSRRASDAAALPHVATRDPTSTRANLIEIPERGPSSYDATNAERAVGQQCALSTLNGKRVSGPVVPPRTYESPTSQNRAIFNEQYLFSSKPPRESQQLLRSPLPRFAPSDVPPSSAIADHFYLPAYDRFGSIQMLPQAHARGKKPFSTRIREFFVKLTEEPTLPSPPPTPAISRKNSFIGNAKKKNGRPAFGQSGGTGDECESDMLVRAIQLNGDMDARNSLATDADVQLYPEPVRGAEKPFFLNNLQSGETSEGNGEKHVSYSQRRKKAKHRIIYNRDTEDAQQRFIIILARALIAFGSPSHRIEPQLASVSTLFELTAQFVHTPGCVQICFGHPESHSSETLLVKASTLLDLGRIHDTHAIYRAVVRDEITATEGRLRLEEIIKRKPIYSQKLLFFLTFVQGFILCGSSFGGSINDMWVAGLLSVLVLLAQTYASRSQLSSSGADIFMAAIVSLVARALSARVPNQIFCYQSISSTGVAGLLPGSIMLSGVLDIASKNIHLGSPKLVAGLMTSLYLGFGLTLGSDVWLHFDSRGRGYVSSLADKFETFNGTFTSTNATIPDWLSPANLTGIWSFREQSAAATHDVVKGCYRDPSWGWWLSPLPWYSLFALLPVLNLVLSMKRAQPLLTTEMPVMIIISCTSTAVTQLANRRMGLSGHPDYAALLGSFVVSLLGNIYSRKMGGTAFTVMLTGIWLLIPTGLAEAGGLSSSYTAPGEDEYTESLDLARKMISVIIGVMSGVYLSARIVYTFGKKKNSAFVTF